MATAFVGLGDEDTDGWEEWEVCGLGDEDCDEVMPV